MQAFHKPLLLLLALVLCFTIPMSAQHEQNDQEETKVIIITKSVDENGEKVIQKIVKKGADAEKYMDGNSFESDGKKIIINIDDEDGEEHHFNFDFDEDDGQKRIRIKGIDENGEAFDIDWEGEGEIPAEIQSKMDAMSGTQGATCNKRVIRKFHGGDDDSGFLGVMLGKKVENINEVETTHGESDLGVVVTDVVAGSAAEEAGLQANDIINSLNGEAIKTIDELTAKIGGNKAGDQIKVGFVRDGKTMEVNATLKARQHNSRGHRSFHWESKDGEDFHFGDYQKFRRQACKPFIGVYLNLGEDQEEGISVRRVIPNTPAEEVNLQVGDVITAIDGINVASHGALIVERDKHEAGDNFTLTFVRDGVSKTIDATFPSCEEMADSPMETKVIIIKKDKTEIDSDKEEEVSPVNPFSVPESTLTLNNFGAFPNPTEGLINIRFAAAAEPTVVSVTNISGREIFKDELNTFDGIYNRQVDLSNAAAGTLLLSIRQGDQVFTDKIILRKGN